jgi:hypothetical protein
VVGDKRKVDSFQNPELLAEFIKSDDWRYYAFFIGRNYSPGDPAISTEVIDKTIAQEFDKLVLLYRFVLKV